MKLKYYPPQKLKEEILKIIGQYLDLQKYKIFFFGSRVKGSASERSDIDIGIEGPNEIPASIELKIKEELEKIPTLYKLELVDFKKVSDKFKKIAKQHIEYVK